MFREPKPGFGDDGTSRQLNPEYPSVTTVEAGTRKLLKSTGFVSRRSRGERLEWDAEERDRTRGEASTVQPGNTVTARSSSCLKRSRSTKRVYGCGARSTRHARIEAVADDEDPNHETIGSTSRSSGNWQAMPASEEWLEVPSNAEADNAERQFFESLTRQADRLGR